jgi:hypothetical protein
LQQCLQRVHGHTTLRSKQSVSLQQHNSEHNFHRTSVFDDVVLQQFRR